MYRFYYSPTSLAGALALKAQFGDSARVIAGGTDLLIELDRRTRQAPDGEPPGLIDLTCISGLAEIDEAEGRIHLGALVTHNNCVASATIVEKAFPLARACWEVGSPQIRNRGTLAGNIVTASPANDTIVPLQVLDATVTVQSLARGERTLPLAAFITGFRQVDLAPDEILTRISLRRLAVNERGNFIKLGLRRAQAITVNSIAAVVELADSECTGEDCLIQSARISLGAVAPTIIRAGEAESYLAGRSMTDEVIGEAARLAAHAASPIDDIRGSGEYRQAMVEALTVRILRQIRDGRQRQGWRDRPVLLWGETNGRWPVRKEAGGEIDRNIQSLSESAATVQMPDQPVVLTSNTVLSTVNDAEIALPTDMTLLDSLRQAGVNGVKEGCAEGECGACTVFLDGIAVMACLVPAERAAGSQVTTVEGLGNPDRLHPIQAALVSSGGVQCGYCTPGFVMSAAKLLEERPQPTRSEAQEALTGNLCRCTGYRKILDAVVKAGLRRHD